jgi:hypothetical protein
VNITTEGNAEMLGLPVAQGVLDPAMIGNLQEAGVQRMSINLAPNGLFLAANDHLLPSVTWDEASLDTVVRIAGPLSGLGAEGLASILDIATGIGPNVAINLPPAEGAEVLELPAPADMPTEFAPVEPNPQGVTLRVTADVDSQGNLTTLGGLSADDFAMLGVTLPPLPPELLEVLQNSGAPSVQIDTEPGALIVRVGDSEAMRVAYDTDALTTALNIAVPFAEGTPLTDPVVDTLLREQILPLLPTADVNVTLNLQ